MPETTNVSPLGMIGEGLNIAGQVGTILGIGQKRQDQRQINQQQKLINMQAGAQRGLADYQQQLQMDMWHKTNYGAQVDELNKAGLNPALLYGKGGGGGTTTGAAISTGVSGGQAANAAATQQAATGQGMMIAQMRLMEAQTKKTEAEAVKISTTDTAESQARTTSIGFQNELNKTIGISDMVARYGWASDKIATESQKVNAEYEVWKTAGFEGKTFDDPTSPMAKAMTAGLEKSIQELEAAKLGNDAQAATNIVKNFEARLAEQGIHPHSPWWTKLITDMLQKVGLADMIGDAQKSML